MRVENWCGHDIRFVEIDGEWWAILKDICDALKLRAKDVSQRIHPEMLERVLVDVSKAGSNDVRYDHQPVRTTNSAMIGTGTKKRNVSCNLSRSKAATLNKFHSEVDI